MKLPGSVSTAQGAGETPQEPSLTRGVTLLFALTSGLAVASVYYAQPLLDRIADAFSLSHALAGLVITITQAGYAAGLLAIAPLGDRLDRRRLVVGQALAIATALFLVASAPGAGVLFLALTALGSLAVLAQILVAYAADLAPERQRGRAVGTVTSGIIVGILLARFIAGTLSDLAGWRSVYAFSAAAMLVLALTLIRVLPPDGRRSTSLSYPRLIASTAGLLNSNPVLRVRAGLAFFIFAAVTMLWTPMVLPLTAPPYRLTHSEVGLFGLAGAMGALGATVSGRLADQGLAERTSGLALALMLVAWAPIALLPWSLSALVAGVLLIDFALQSAHVANQSLLHETAPGLRSRLTAAYMLFYSAGSAAGSAASTLIYAQCGWLGVCAGGAVTSLAGLVFWACCRSPMRRMRPADA